MTQLSKNWASSKLSEVYSVRKFHRKDGGVTVQYYMMDSNGRSSWMSERFEAGEEAQVRKGMPAGTHVTEGGIR